LRLLENGRSEDRERLKELERTKEDQEAWTLARPKLQNKLVELAAEVKELRKLAREHESERDGFEKRLEEVNDQLELAALDKETAEEKLEQAVIDLESEKERKAELQVELEVLKSEEARIVSQATAGQTTEEGENSTQDPATQSLAFVQLAKQNDRLKEALVRLRDISVENEGESKRRITDLEKELDLTSDLQEEYEQATSQLEKAEEMVENLKLQLDDAMGAEDMLEHLTERNLTLSEVRQILA
jgi:dynactin 1